MSAHASGAVRGLRRICLAMAMLLLTAALAVAGSPAANAASGWNGFGVGVWPTALWRPYAPSSPFNQTTTGQTVHPNSAGLVAKTLSLGTIGSLVDAVDATNDWAHPTYYAQPTDPVFTLDALGSPRAIDGMQIRIPDAAKPALGGDGHMTVVTPDGWEYDFWQVKSKPKGGGTMTFTGGGRTRIDGDGLKSGATAALFGNLAGVIRAQELAAGRIDHALFIVIRCTGSGTSFGYGTVGASSSGGSYVYPAYHGGARCSTDSPDLPPLGARFKLELTDTQIAALSVPSWKKTILRALSHYGGYVGDTGGAGFGLMLESSNMYSAFGMPDPLAAFARLNGVPMYNGQYVFNIASGVDWARYLRVLAPPSASPPPPEPEPEPEPEPDPTPGSSDGWNGFGVANWPGADWRPYDDLSPFNRRAEGIAVHPDSAQMVQRALAWGLPGNLVDAADATNDWAHPTYYAQPTDPVFTLDALGSPRAIDGYRIRIPDAARPAAGGDGHMTVVTPDGWEYDFFDVQSKPSGGGTMTFTSGGRTRIDGYGLGSGATDALFGNLAGVIRAQELAAGRIDHALLIVLRCTSNGGTFGYGTSTGSGSRGSYVYPAQAAGAGCDDPDLPPLGARFRLDMTETEITALSVPGWKKTILRALSRYGGYVGETGGPGFGLMLESSTMYTAFGLSDRLAVFAKANGVPMWNGQYVFNLANGVDWARYLRVLVPPQP
jgi:hypothetical protein